MVWKEFCYRKVETWGDVEDTVRWWQDNLIWLGKWSEVLQRRTIRCGCIDKELCGWGVRLWAKIRMVHWGMEDDSRVADKLYIKRVLLALEGFLFFSLYLFSCIAKQVTTLKQLQLLPGLDSLNTNFERPLFLSDTHFSSQYHLHPIPPVTQTSLAFNC